MKRVNAGYDIEFNLENYNSSIVAYIDILGFTSFVNDLEISIENIKKINEIIEIIDWTTSQRKVSDMTSYLMAKGLPNPMSFSVISDSIFIVYNLENIEKATGNTIDGSNFNQSVFNVFCIIANLYFDLLRIGFLLSGGVSFGKAFHEDIITIGTGVNNAVHVLKKKEEENKYNSLINMPKIYIHQDLIDRCISYGIDIDANFLFKNEGGYIVNVFAVYRCINSMGRNKEEQISYFEQERIKVEENIKKYSGKASIVEKWKYVHTNLLELLVVLKN